ncbi:hypothetical protein PHYC_00155 [Phycisphaerales bacterium]|nr:hypothetical protein PHYC_00155 [Phycisphaerales bacterium]
MLTLWDLIEPVSRLLAPRRQPASPPRPARPPAQRSPIPTATPIPARKPTATDRYESIARELLATHNIRVRKWRKSSSGVAVVVTYRNGAITRYIESPRPRGPLSMAIFLHEIGHHVFGVGSIEPRCLEEYHAWMFALREMESRRLNVTDSVRRRVHKSLAYAVRKAQRRGLKQLPTELRAYT